MRDIDEKASTKEQWMIVVLMHYKAYFNLRIQAARPVRLRI